MAPFGFTAARWTILDRIKNETGFGSIEQMFVGAAPVDDQTVEFYEKMNMPLVNLYGLSETSGALTIHEFPNSHRSKAGPPIAGTDVLIFNPNEDGEGEICVRGRHVFMGYLNNEKATWDVFDSQGYFHTGDTGILDSEGNLTITGRLKELLITSGGENVSPVPIEMTFKATCPIVSHAVVIGDGRKYLAMLITL